MMQKVKGDILHSKCHAIAHGISPNDDFKHGLSLALRQQWPALYKDFRHYVQSSHPKAGSLWTWRGAGGPFIINLFTHEGQEGHQASSAGKASLGEVGHCLKALRKEIQDKHITSLALPRIGSGRGGLDWQQVERLVVEHLSDVGIPVVVYENFSSGLEADEKLF